MPTVKDDLPKLKGLDSATSPPSTTKNSVEDFWQKLEPDEQSKIIERLSCEDTLADLDPVIIMDYRNDSLQSLHVHLTGLAVGDLPAFLGGAMPESAAVLASAITTEVANNQGVVVSSRVITQLNSFQGGVCLANATTMVNTTLRHFVVASGAGVLVDVRHLVSHNREPPNDIGMNTLTL